MGLNMLIKPAKIISCSSEHPLYPSKNLLDHPPKSSWRCAKPNEVMATVVVQLQEASPITGLEVGNYHSCIVIVEASTSEEPDKWIPIINHQFLSHDEAANSKFRPQVRHFTRRELNPETVKLKLDRVKITCMQSANPRELFGLEFIILKTDVIVDLGLDVFGRFKLKQKDEGVEDPRDKCVRLFDNKTHYKNDLKKRISENGVNNFMKRQEESRKPKKRPILEEIETDNEAETDSDFPSASIATVLGSDVEGRKNFSWKKNGHEQTNPIARTLFGDVIPGSEQKKNSISKWKKNYVTDFGPPDKSPITKNSSSHRGVGLKVEVCSICTSKSNELCKKCKLLPKPSSVGGYSKQIPKTGKKPKLHKQFNKLFGDILFSLSGYVNPQRDEIRQKALKMGAKYVADPNTTNNRCTHLICAFKNTPKSQQLKGHCKIVGHKFVEDCYDKKRRLSWRQYAFDSSERNHPESEEEIDGNPLNIPSVYDQETDDSDGDY